MRMRRSLMKKYHLRKRVPKKDKEGGSITEYAEAVEINATIWPASGRVQAEMYGERLTYIKTWSMRAMRPCRKVMAFVYLWGRKVRRTIRLSQSNLNTAQS